MAKPHQRKSPDFKHQVALEALKGDQTIAQLGAQYGLHPKQIQRWRDQLIIESKDIFIHKSTRKARDSDSDRMELLHIIEKLNLELDYLKKKLRDIP